MVAWFFQDTYCILFVFSALEDFFFAFCCVPSANGWRSPPPKKSCVLPLRYWWYWWCRFLYEFWNQVIWGLPFLLSSKEEIGFPVEIIDFHRFLAPAGRLSQPHFTHVARVAFRQSVSHYFIVIYFKSW